MNEKERILDLVKKGVIMPCSGRPWRRLRNRWADPAPASRRVPAGSTGCTVQGSGSGTSFFSLIYR